MNNPNPKGITDEFLNAKSMITPGIAGGMTMLITNALATQFGLPPNYTGLVVSFLFGSLAFLSPAIAHTLERILFYFLNSLIIFSVAVGANQAGVATAKGKELRNASATVPITLS